MRDGEADTRPMRVYGASWLARTQVDFDLVDLGLDLDRVGVDGVDEVGDGRDHVAEAEGADELGDDRVDALGEATADTQARV